MSPGLTRTPTPTFWTQPGLVPVKHAPAYASLGMNFVEGGRGFRVSVSNIAIVSERTGAERARKCMECGEDDSPPPHTHKQIHPYLHANARIRELRPRAYTRKRARAHTHTHTEKETGRGARPYGVQS